MFSIIVAIYVAIWYFGSARSVGKSGSCWAALGVLAFIAPGIPWAVFARLSIVPVLINADIGEEGAIVSGLLIGLVGIGLGLALVLWIHRTNLRPVFELATSLGTATEPGPSMIVRAAKFKASCRWLTVGAPSAERLFLFRMTILRGECASMIR